MLQQSTQVLKQMNNTNMYDRNYQDSSKYLYFFSRCNSKVLDNSFKASSRASYTITSTFKLITSEKVWAPLSAQLWIK